MSFFLQTATSAKGHPLLPVNRANVSSHLTRHQWLLSLLLTGFTSLSWGQCFNATTIPLGNPSFIPVGILPQSVAVGDFNGDGKQDMAVTNIGIGSNNVSVLLGNGSGGFGIPVNFTAGSIPRFVAVSDFNGDGKADLAVANSFSNNVSILLGNGSGGFAPAVNFNVGLEPYAIAISDFNGDGKPDLAVANRASDNVSTLLGDGNGSFQITPTNFAVGDSPFSLAAGDFNGDGKTDLAVSNVDSDNLSILLGNGSGGFAPAVNYPTGDNPFSVVIGDFNGDGKADLAVANINSANVSIRLGNGDGSFGMAPNVAVGGNPASVVIGDFNGDGKADFATATFSSNTISIRLGNGDGSFGMAPNVTVGDSPRSLAIGDLNGDNKPDLITANSGSNNVSVLLGKGDGSFGAIASTPRSVAVADFNADGKPDLAVSNSSSNNVSILLATGSGNFGVGANFLVGTTPFFVAVADFNGDGRPDLVTANFNSDNVSVRLGNGDGSFGMAPDVAVGDGPASVVTGDFNGDGKIDIATSNANSNNVSVLLGNGLGSFGGLTNFAVGTTPQTIAVGDFNGDGKLDLATANNNSGNASVLLGDGLGGFGAATNLAAGSVPIFVAIGDVNADGKADLAVANNISDNVSILLGNGSGGFGAPTNFSAGNNPSAVVLRDINGDSKLDLFVTNFNSNNVSVLLGNGSGGFGTPTNFAVGAQPTSIAGGDFNADGKLDFVTANSGSNNISLLSNCTDPAPGNTAPTVANAIAPQSATVGQGFTLSLASTFTDAETPGSLVLTATGLPAGLSLAGTTINGTPSASGVSTVTIIATDPGSLSVSTTFTLTVNPASGPPIPGGPFAITGVTTLNCTPVGNRVNISFQPQYVGLDGSPITFSVINETLPTTNPGPYPLSVYTDNPTITLQAIQSGVTSTFAYNWLAACSGPSPANTAPTVANIIPNQTGTAGTAFSYLIPANTFTDVESPDSLVLSATGLPPGLNLSGSTISGTPSTTVGSPFLVTVTATDPGSLSVSTTFTFTINPGPVMPPSGFAITGVTLVGCVTEGDRKKLTFTPQYAGLDGQPITFRVINETLPTTNPGPYSVSLYVDNPNINLEAVQSGAVANFTYNWLAACGAPRVAAEPTAPLRVRVLGNPVQNMVDVEVEGGQGAALKLSLIDMQSRVVGQSQTEQAGPTERYRFDVTKQPAGVLLLQVTTPDQAKTVRILKVN